MAASATSYELISAKKVSLGEAPECSICNERYDDCVSDRVARMLSCGHSMCSKCIFRYMKLSGSYVQGGMEVSCPNKCTSRTFVPDSRIENIPKNFALMDLVHNSNPTNSITRSPGQRPHSLLSVSDSYFCDVCETNEAAIVCPNCSVVLCPSCSYDIHKRKGYQLHQLIPIAEYISDQDQQITKQRTLSESSSQGSMEERLCKSHALQTLDFFCENCYEQVCKVCKQSEHKHHKCLSLDEFSAAKKESLKQIVEEVNSCYDKWNDGFDSCQAAKESVFGKQEALEELIKSHFATVRSDLREREEVLLSQVKDEVKARSKLLDSQANQLARMCAVAKETIQECKTLLNQSEPHEVATNSDKLLAQAQQCVRSVQDTTPMVTDCIEADFESQQSLVEAVKRLGELKIAPDRVTDLKVTAQGSSGQLLNVSWQPPSERECEDLLYTVEHRAGDGEFSVVYEGRGTEYMVESKCDTHQFRVTASNEVGQGPYSIPETFTPQKAAFLWDPNLKYPRAQISNNGYTVSIGENAFWVSVGTNIVLSHGTHYWEVVLDQYGNPSMSRKVVVGVASSPYNNWQRSHGVIGIMTSAIGSRSWGLACGTAKKLNRGSTFLQSLSGKHRVFKEGDAVGVLLDLSAHKMAFYRNGEALGIEFDDVTGPVIPSISFCRHKSLTLRFPPFPRELPVSPKELPGSPKGASICCQRPCAQTALV